LAQVQAALGDANAAVHTLSQSIELAGDPKVAAPSWMPPVVHFDRGELYRSAGCVADAVADFEQAVTGFSAIERPKDRIAALIELGRTLRDHDTWERAEPHLRLALSLAAAIDDPRLRWRSLGELGIGLQRAGQPYEAVSLLQEALDLRIDEGSSHHASQLVHLALALSELGRGGEATAVLDANWRDPSLSWTAAARLELANARAIVAERMGQPAEAIAWYRRGLDSGASGASAAQRWAVMMNLAQLHAKQRQGRAALDALDEAERLFGPPPASLTARGCAIRAAVQVLARGFVDAEQSARRGIEALEPACPPETRSSLYFWHGEALHHLGRHEEAVHACEQARDLAPTPINKALALQNLAASLHALNKHAAARKAEQEAAALAPPSRPAPQTKAVLAKR